MVFYHLESEDRTECNEKIVSKKVLDKTAICARIEMRIVEILFIGKSELDARKNSETEQNLMNEKIKLDAADEKNGAEIEQEYEKKREEGKTAKQRALDYLIITAADRAIRNYMLNHYGHYVDRNGNTYTRG